MGKTHQRKSQKEPKTKDIQRVKINHSPRSGRSGDQGHYTTESHRYSTTEVHTITHGDKMEKLKKQRLTESVSLIMGRQRNKHQMKGKDEASETMLNEKEASQLSDIEFKELVIRKLNELTQNYQNYTETVMNSLQNIST